MDIRKKAELIAQLINTAGGKFVGRLKLQKAFYLLQIAGLEPNFTFEYYHYGPYSEGLSVAMDYGIAYNIFNDEEIESSAGCVYSVFKKNKEYSDCGKLPDKFHDLVRTIAKASSIEVELAVTALFLRVEENSDCAWQETALRKVQKAKDGRLEKAKALYEKLRKLSTALPEIE